MGDRSIDVVVVCDTGLDPRLEDQDIENLVRFAFEHENLPGDWRVSIRFVETETICDLHLRYMHDPDPTDILTFPYDEPDLFGGDIAIAVPVAEEQAREAAASVEHEVAFLVLHGLLHLAGYDDRHEGERTAMLDRQTQILDAWFAVRS